VPDSISIVAHANCDDTYVVWRYPKAIPDCRGFALYRKPKGEEAEPVHTFTPFAGGTKEEGEHRPGTEWPIQRFGWTDVFASPGKTLSYRVVPMVGKEGELEELTEQASPWSDPVEVTANAGDGLSAYFNRGVLSTQSLAHRLKADKPWTQKLRDAMKVPGDSLRNYLSGELRPPMLRLLAEAKDDPQVAIYAALFQLDDPELIAGLCAIGPRAHVILANGPDGEGDDSAAARKTLREAKVDVYDRMTGDRLAHNKFLVFAKPETSPQRVWTGSTNWTMTGLCSQVNNGLLIEREEVARYYMDQWTALEEAGSAFPEKLVSGNGQKRSRPLAKGSIGTWFVPVVDQVDLVDARSLIAEAKRGILFLMFNPGPSESLFNAIMDRADPGSPKFDPDLYVHGVLNQDPQSRSKDEALIGLIHRGELDKADPDIVLPSSVDKRFASWDKEPGALDIVKVHSKVVLLDPFGPKPVVMTGSHNLGPRASRENDDNLNLIEAEPGLAAAYATHIIAVYNAYRWRYVRSQKAKEAGKEWEGPEDGAAWQDKYYEGEDFKAKQRELAFWLGE
jgi:phosphatidylserine/phosphatidylglycerophosphate/cardiolipin synthase-like enzyme